MLDKVENLKPARRNSIGLCENNDRNFDKDYSPDSRVLTFNPLKIQQQGLYSPHQQLLQYLQQTHYQQLQGHRYLSSPPHHVQSQCCHEQSGVTAFPFIVKSEVRSSTENRRFLSPSPKECKEEGEEKRGGHGDHLEEEEKRMLLQERLGGLHPSSITESRRAHGDRKQQSYYHHPNHQEAFCDNADSKMDNEEDFDIKVDDIDVDFNDTEDKDTKFKFNNFNDSSSSITGRRSCSISISSNSSSTSGSVCSGDEDDADSGIDGGHHKDNNNKDRNDISLEDTELGIIDYTSSKNTCTDTESSKDTDYNKNTRVKTNDPHQHIPPNHNTNRMKETFIVECGHFQNRRTPLSPGSPREQSKNLSAIFTHEDSQNPPDLTRKFTNFFINDILKPEFGKKPFETGTTTIPTLTPVDRRFKSTFPSTSFPFSISSLSSQSSLLSPSSSSSSSLASSQNTGVSPSGKKKSFSRYGSDPRCPSSSSSSKSSTSLTSSSVASLDSSRSLHHTESVKQKTPKKDLTTSSADPSKSSEEGLEFKYPAWVFCTRYSDRPSSGPRSRKMKRKDKKADEKRPRTAFTPDQLQKLKREFDLGRYLTEERRQALAKELGLNESQIKIWFQNKRAKMKKVSGTKNPLALQLIAEGLYNHQTNKDQL